MLPSEFTSGGLDRGNDEIAFPTVSKVKESPDLRRREENPEEKT